jgi:hypothetical protein
MKSYNPYIKQSIDLAEKSKDQLVITRELIDSTTDDKELGFKIREMLQQRIKEADEHIEYMLSLRE